MKTDQILKVEEAYLNQSSSEVIGEQEQWQLDTEPSNIIRLAEQGQFYPQYLRDKISEDFVADPFCPLNEW